MSDVQHLLEKNRAWASQIKETDATFFQRLSHQQSPQYLWIGCSDSRVPSSQLVDLMPGEMFVHRNVANMVIHTDLNCLSVVQFAVEALRVKHIIVCGHYGCGGVQAALSNTRFGLIDNWLRHVQDVMQKHSGLLSEVPDEARRARKLCELNVVEQVVNVCRTTIVEQAWEREQALTVHGWIYGVENGLLRDLQMDISGYDDVSACYDNAISRALPVELKQV